MRWTREVHDVMQNRTTFALIIGALTVLSVVGIGISRLRNWARNFDSNFEDAQRHD